MTERFISSRCAFDAVDALARLLDLRIKQKSQSFFCNSLGWRHKPRQSGLLSGCQRRALSVSGTRQGMAGKHGEPIKQGIGSCDRTGLDVWEGRFEEHIAHQAEVIC